MSILDTLGRRHGTDKASGSHDYLHWYERHLSHLRDKPITLLEIGVGDGASLRMWRDYFQLAKIVGMDIASDRESHRGDRVEIEIGDQGNEEDLRRIAQRHVAFDVIVDDAGHNPSDQVRSYRFFMPYLRAGGIYILEDIGGQEAVDLLKDIAGKVICGNLDNPFKEIESIAFYRESTVTRLKGQSQPENHKPEINDKMILSTLHAALTKAMA